MKLVKLKKAFTLIEIVIALAALGTIYSMSSANFNSYQEMSAREQQKMGIQQVKNAVDNHYAKNNKYPTTPLQNQPSKDSWSKIDMPLLVDNRYLQAIIKPSNIASEYFAVDANGVVSVQSAGGENVVIESGSIVISEKKDAGDETKANLEFDIFVDTEKTVSNITITADPVDVLFSGAPISVNNPAISATTDAENGIYTGAYSTTVSIKNEYGQKKFKTKITYSNGTSKEIESTIQYAVDTQGKSDLFYWKTDDWSATNINPNGLVSLKPSEVSAVTVSAESSNQNISLDWSNRQVATVLGVVKYEIHRIINGTDDDVFTTNSTSYVDSTVKDGINYEYRIYAVNTNQQKTSNYLNATNASVVYTDTVATITNLTKNDYDTASNKEVAVKAIDPDGIKKVYINIAKIVGNAPLVKNLSEYTTYEMYKTTTETEGTTYSVPVQIMDDYMVYFIEVVDTRGYSTYCYYNKSYTPSSGLSEDVVDTTIPGTISGSTVEINLDECYVLMKGLREIFSDGFADFTNIESNPETDFHLFEGKIYLP